MDREKKNRIKSKLILLLLCFLVTFSILLFRSKNSFLFEFNDWVDMNWYVSLGRSVASGKVMYRDIYEQKGPITYFVFAFLSLFGNTYYACFVLECICMTLFMYFSYKFLRNFLSNFGAFIGAAVTLVATCMATCFSQGGGAVEEYMLPIIAYLIYRVYDVLRNPQEKNFSKAESVLVGVLLALIFWVKYSVIIIPAALILTWFIAELVHKNFEQTFADLGMIMVGFIVLTLPIMFYFLANGALKDLISCYFYDNLIRYDSLNFNFFLYSMVSLFRGSLPVVLFNALMIWYVLLANIYFFVKDKKVTVLLLSALLEFVILLNLKVTQIYYSLVLTAFLSIIFLPIVKLIEYAIEKIKKGTVLRAVKISVFAVVLASLLTVVVTQSDTRSIGRSLDSYPAAVVVNDIKNSTEEDKSFYCYMMADYGLYNIAGVIPEEKYYVRNNFTPESYPEMYDSINKAMESQKYNFIVTVLSSYNSYRTLLEENNYKVYKQYGEDGESFVLLVKNN